ncbi:MAG: NAD(+)/NADH kinase [Clostridia bacterium]|nr:NAD(+)/NADH kinase [Clostridia bacterium]
MKVAIAINRIKTGAEEAAKKLSEIVNSFKAEAFVADNDDIALCGADIDLIISLGGDGTLLHLAGLLLENGVKTPILGVNYGHTGFMSAIDFNKCTADDFKPYFEEELSVEERAVITAEIKRKGETVSKSYALNDFVVLRSRKAHASEYIISSNGKEISRLLADGIIFSTPTGSTAYSLSAGGPIVDPAVNAIVVTPICAHNLFAKSMVFSEKTVLKLSVSERSDSVIYAQNDGATVTDLIDGDEVVIRTSSQKVRLVKPNGKSFFDIVNEKLK